MEAAITNGFAKKKDESEAAVTNDFAKTKVELKDDITEKVAKDVATKVTEKISFESTEMKDEMREDFAKIKDEMWVHSEKEKTQSTETLTAVLAIKKDEMKPEDATATVSKDMTSCFEEMTGALVKLKAEMSELNQLTQEHSWRLLLQQGRILRLEKDIERTKSLLYHDDCYYY